MNSFWGESTTEVLLYARSVRTGQNTSLGSLWLSIALYDSLWRSLALSGSLWLSLALSGLSLALWLSLSHDLLRRPLLGSLHATTLPRFILVCLILLSP